MKVTIETKNGWAIWRGYNPGSGQRVRLEKSSFDIADVNTDRSSPEKFFVEDLLENPAIRNTSGWMIKYEVEE